jgi:Fe-Mn family superoxide dismutase
MPTRTNGRTRTSNDPNAKEGFMNARTSLPFQLPALPWKEGELDPVISAHTIALHHGKHHKAYVEKLNELVAGTSYADLPLREVVAKAMSDTEDRRIFNNAAQHWNHSFFWRCLRPAGGEGPREELRSALAGRFDSLPSFKKQFSEKAVANFGSGWTWLVSDRSGELEIVSTSNAGTPLRDGGVALLTCDVWEHAYYVDYENRRPDYLKAFWEIVDWERVSQRYAAAQRSSATASDRPERSTRA